MNQTNPPESNEDIQEALNFEKPDFVFIPNGVHTYRQNGPYLVCKSCEIQHATWVGMDKIMVGMDEKGAPIIKNRIELNM